MEQHQLLETYYNQIDFCYGNVEWTHKIHEKAADIFTAVDSWLQWGQLVLSFIVSADVVSQLQTKSPIISTFLVVCSLLLTLITSITKTFDFAGRANKHILAANSLWGLREDYRSFKNDIRSGILTIDQIIVKRKELQDAVQEVYKTAPRTFDKAYRKAQEDFENGKVTFSHLDEH